MPDGLSPIAAASLTAEEEAATLARERTLMDARAAGEARALRDAMGRWVETPKARARRKARRKQERASRRRNRG